jgi:ATP-dependent RNA helicase DHX36
VKSYFLEDVLTMTGFAEEHARNLNNDPLLDPSRLTNEDREAMDDALARAWMEADFEPLMELVAYGDRGANKLLVNYQHSETGASPLMVASGKGRVDDVAMLLELGADTNLASWDGATATEWAENFEFPEIVGMIQSFEEKVEASREKDTEAAVLRKYQQGVDVEEVDLKLIQQVRVLQRILYRCL